LLFEILRIAPKKNKKRDKEGRKEGNIHWSKMNYKEHQIMYFATNVITGIKSRKRAQALYVSCMGEIKNPLKALVGNSKMKR